jgi:Methane oxygenase PmoA
MYLCAVCKWAGGLLQSCHVMNHRRPLAITNSLALRENWTRSDWPTENWYDYTIRLKSDGKTVGVAVLDHPLNPPTRWHNARYLWMLNPCITTFGSMTIHPDSPMVLRYRVVVHDGGPPTDLLQKLSQEWGGEENDPFAHP